MPTNPSNTIRDCRKSLEKNGYCRCFFFNIRAGFMFRYNPSGSSHHFLHVRTACGLSSNGKTNDAMGPNLLGHFFFPQQCSSKCPKHMPRISIFPPPRCATWSPRCAWTWTRGAGRWMRSWPPCVARWNGGRVQGWGD